jgi:hypothetical protein
MPTDTQRAALERVVQTWFRDSLEKGYPETAPTPSTKSDLSRAENDDEVVRGYSHGLTDPLWEGPIVSWQLVLLPAARLRTILPVGWPAGPSAGIALLAMSGLVTAPSDHSR